MDAHADNTPPTQMSVREEDADVSAGTGRRVHGVRCAPNSSRSLPTVCFGLITQEINGTGTGAQPGGKTPPSSCTVRPPLHGCRGHRDCS